MDTYPITIGNLTRRVPLHEPFPGVRLPLIDFLGDVGLAKALADALVKHVPAETDVLVTAETSSIPLVHEMAALLGKPYVVVRKRRRPYMHDPLIQEVESLTLGANEVLWLDRRYVERLLNQKVTLVIDVVASGGTMHALERLVHRAGAEVVARLAAFRQGTPKVEVVALEELPVL